MRTDNITDPRHKFGNRSICELNIMQKKDSSILKLTMYTDLCLRASLYSSFCSGRGLSWDLLTFVLSSLSSKRPVFDFSRAEMMTLLSVVKDFSLRKEKSF